LPVKAPLNLPLPLAALLSGLLLFAAVPPIDFGFLAFFALVPLLYATLNSMTHPAAARYGFIAGAAFFMPSLFWLTSVTVLGWVALALYCALYFAAFAIFARVTRGALAPTVAFWVLLEYFRGAVAFTGFPWILLSHTQHEFLAFAQVLDVVGSYGLSAILLAINILFYRALVERRHSDAVIALAIVAVVCIYGIIRIRTLEVEPLLRVAMAQASIPQEMKEILDPEGRYDPEGVLDRYVAASDRIVDDRVDLVVWPETVVLSPYILNVSPEILNEDTAKHALRAQSVVEGLARKHSAFVLVGATSFLPAEHGYVSDPKIARQIPGGNWRKRYNSAYLFDPEGRYVDRYDKTHLVPFGEYIPLPNLFPFLAQLVPFDASLSPGDRQTMFIVTSGLRPSTFGVLICYEDTNSEMARGLRRDGADFLINISNDAWFGLSELDQHFIAAQYRAIENRVGVVRSGNNGITGVIDPAGRVGRTLEKNAIDAIVDSVSTTNARSLYTRFGDRVAVLFSLALVLGYAIRELRERTR
jgi:apolipoprotein N-acyltransferase